MVILVCEILHAHEGGPERRAVRPLDRSRNGPGKSGVSGGPEQQRREAGVDERLHVVSSADESFFGARPRSTVRMAGLFACRKATSERREIRLLWILAGCREIARYGRNTLVHHLGGRADAPVSTCKRRGRSNAFRQASARALRGFLVEFFWNDFFPKPHPEERAIGRASRRMAQVRGHPSRRRLRRLLWMRSR